MANRKKTKPRAQPRDHGFDYVDHALKFQSEEKINGLSGPETRAYASAIMQRESGGVLDQHNKKGYFGQYQFGADALVETGLVDRKKYENKIKELKKNHPGDEWKEIWYKEGDSLQEKFLRDRSNWKIDGGLDTFLSDKTLQDKKFVEYTNKQIQQGIHFKAISGQESSDTIAAYAAAAHLTGAGGANKLFKNNVATRDANGTSSKEYAQIARKAIKELAPKIAEKKTTPGEKQVTTPGKTPQKKSNQKQLSLLETLEAEIKNQLARVAAIAQPAAKNTDIPSSNNKNNQGEKIIQAAKSYFKPGKFEYGRPDSRSKNKSRNGKTDTSRLEEDADGDGLKGVDCSALVWRALKESGVPLTGLPTQAGFTTRSLFNGSTVTELAKKNFTPISKDKALEPGAMKPGDLMMFSGKGGQHVAIFEGYDKDGKAKFFGSQTSTGPASTYLQSWEWKKRFNGALRLKNNGNQEKVNVIEGKASEATNTTIPPKVAPTNPNNKKTSQTSSQQQADVNAVKNQKAEKAKAKQRADAEAAKQKAAEQAKAKQRADAEAAKQKAAEQAKAKQRADAEAAKQKAAEQAKAKQRADAEAAKQKAAEQAKAKQRADVEAAKQKAAEQAKAKQGVDAEAVKRKEAEQAQTKIEAVGKKEPVQPKQKAAAKPAQKQPAQAKPAQPAGPGNLDAQLAQLAALLGQLNAALAPLAKPIQITVDVQNGNIVAAVNAANSQQQRRN
ncbi:NlpC/P60 family protein [Chromobacterium violaceum]|uniref:NlpC/P60 domain-containing protein n=1 Tax=Chromobacterium violaceum TaxID=536 RepID=A0A202B4F3_CHRVL|nr:NlpC/P60 family protein [Chromobacterium violaceum]OVE46335.1 hypothetical protein CBW21_18895 [Chromobacterium violaceum]